MTSSAPGFGSRISRTTIWAAATASHQLATAAASAVFLMVTSRHLELNSRGLLALVVSIAVIAGTLSPVGSTHALIHFGQRGARPQATLAKLWPLILAGFVVGSSTAGLALRYAAQPGRRVMVLAIVGVLLYGAVQITQAILYGCSDVRAVATSRILAALALAIGTLTLTHTSSYGPDVFAALWVTSLGLTLGLQTRRLALADLPRLGTLPNTVRSYAIRSAPTNLAYILAGRVDLWIVGITLGLKQVALYSFALGVVEISLIVTQGFASTFQMLAASPGAPTRPRAQVVLKVLALQASISFATAFLAAAYAGRLISPEYGELWQVLLVLAGASLFMSCQRLLGSWAIGSGAPTAASASATAMALSVGLATLVLTPRFGILGAAVASAVGYGVGAGVIVGLTGRRTGTEDEYETKR